MRAPGAVVLCGLAGCTFAGSPVNADGPIDPTGDGPAADSDPSAIDAAAPDASGLCGGTVWFADFNGDPTQQDLNGDTVPDWAMRDGSQFPAGQLTGGTWLSPASVPPLDSRPTQPFLTRTIVDVRMRNTSTCCARGAVFWINVGLDGTGFAAVFVDVKLTGANQQTVKFVRKTATGVEDQFAMVSGFDGGFVDVHLDIDPVALTVQYSAGAVDAIATLFRQTTAANDGWATLTAYSSESEFDEVRVEVCPGS